MAYYAPELTLRVARQQYFDRAGFVNGGYDDRWVRLKAGPFVFYFPNTAARKRAVKLHDLHHVLAEYETTWRGEAEIAAWEIASGCGRHVPAWVLNAGAFAIGLLIAPRRTYRAFLRGRHSRNLYSGVFTDDLLDRVVSNVRKELALDMPITVSPVDIAAFATWAVVCTVASLLPWAVLIAALVYLVRRVVPSV